MKKSFYEVTVARGKETTEGIVKIRHNTQYAVILTNNNSLPCDAGVTIDGKIIGVFRVYANHTIRIERPINDAGCFTFYRLGTPEAEKACLQKNDQLGVISVLFMPEKPKSPDEKEVRFSVADTGGTGLSGHSDQLYTEVLPLDHDGENSVVINLQLIPDPDDAPRPLTGNTTGMFGENELKLEDASVSKDTMKKNGNRIAVAIAILIVGFVLFQFRSENADKNAALKMLESERLKSSQLTAQKMTDEYRKDTEKIRSQLRHDYGTNEVDLAWGVVKQNERKLREELRKISADYNFTTKEFSDPENRRKGAALLAEVIICEDAVVGILIKKGFNEVLAREFCRNKKKFFIEECLNQFDGREVCFSCFAIGIIDDAGKSDIVKHKKQADEMAQYVSSADAVLISKKLNVVRVRPV